MTEEEFNNLTEREQTRYALECLVAEGYVRSEVGPDGEPRYYSVRPYRVTDDVAAP